MSQHSHPHPHPHPHLHHADPQVLDKLLAQELNSLSFNDREALSEELHGVRSMAPNETPEMIEEALVDLQRGINKRIRALLSSSASVPLIRREYLSELLIASPSSIASSLSSSFQFPEDAGHYPVSVTSSCSTHQLPPITKSSEETTETSIITDCEDGNSTTSQSISCKSVSKSFENYENNADHKYSYAISNMFRIKFLRAELFDVKKAAARYLLCIDFLVDYFGLVALQRPLYLKDLDKAEQKLLKEGRCQLMPTRDRFGRRVIVFSGDMGRLHSHRNRFRVSMYMIFQVASDDVPTQRNGLVAIYSNFDNSSTNFIQLGFHPKQSLMFFNAVPVRYSAFHCFLPDSMNILKSICLNNIGTSLRLITRVHNATSVTETFYKLRCFGIPTEDFPVTSSGSIKTKKLMKWIKFRVALEEAHHRELESPEPLTMSLQEPDSNHYHPTPFLGIECPRLDSVIFRNGGSAWDHPGNVKFREILIRMETKREFQQTNAEKNLFLDGIITELISNGLSFVVYNDEKDWYVKLVDYGTIRKKVFQALRDQSARRKRIETGTNPSGIQRRHHRASIGSGQRRVAIPQVNESSTSLFLELDKPMFCSGMINDVKRRKISDGWIQ